MPATVVGGYALVPAAEAEWGPPQWTGQTADKRTVTLAAAGGTAALTKAGLHPADWGTVGLGLRVDGVAQGPVAFVRKVWAATEAPAPLPLSGEPDGPFDSLLGSIPPEGLKVQAWYPMPATVMQRPKGPDEKDRVRTVAAGAQPAQDFVPMLYQGGPLANSYAALRPKGRTVAFDLIPDLEGRCLAGLPPGKTRDQCDRAMAEYCGDPGGPNFAGERCAQWAATGRAGAMDEAMTRWCQGSSDPRCACLNAAAAGGDGVPPVCTAKECEGLTAATRLSTLLATQQQVDARAGGVCEMARAAAAQTAKAEKAAADGEITRQRKAQRQQELVEGFQASQEVPLWAWLLMAAVLIVCVALFLRLTRAREVVREEDSKPQLPVS